MKDNDSDELWDISVTLVNEKTGEEQIFIWDKRKEEDTIKERGITFRTAAFVFFDERKISRFDIKHDDKEDRFQVIGYSGDILFIITTEQDLNPDKPIRIISVRKAEPIEIEEYYEQSNLMQGTRKNVTIHSLPLCDAFIDILHETWFRFICKCLI